MQKVVSQKNTYFVSLIPMKESTVFQGKMVPRLYRAEWLPFSHLYLK